MASVCFSALSTWGNYHFRRNNLNYYLYVAPGELSQEKGNKTCMSYAEEVTCMSYAEEDTCMSYAEEDTCMSYAEEDTCMSYAEEDT